MNECIVIPKDMLESWDMLSDGELGSVVRTLIRYETTEVTKVFTEKHVRTFYCALVAVQRLHEQMEGQRQALQEELERYRQEEHERQEKSKIRRGAALARWGKSDEEMQSACKTHAKRMQNRCICMRFA